MVQLLILTGDIILINIDNLNDKIKEFDCNINIYKIKFDQIIFEDRVKLNCFYCSKYNTKWTCPPRIPDIDYSKLINEFPSSFDRIQYLL